MNLNYLTHVILGFCVIGTVSATPVILDKDGPICSASLCAFNKPGGIYASITGYYVKPSETGLGLVTDSWLYEVPGGFLAQSKPMDPPHKGAGSVTLGYDLPNSANNIEVSYLYLNNKTHANNDFSDGSIGFGSILFMDAALPPSDDFTSDAYLTYKVEQTDLKIGRKYTDLTHVFSIRPSVGVRYANLQHSLDFAAPGNMHSRFRGIGPLFSLDGNYTLGYGVGLVGYFDYASIVGQASSSSYLNLAGTNFGFNWPKRDRIVSSINGKLGLDYHYTFSNNADLVIEAGYQVNQYVNSMDTIRGTIAFADIQRINGNETNSFSFRGPYLTLGIHA